MITTVMKPITSTIYGAELQTAQLIGAEYPIRENTTLNQKFHIQEGVVHSAGTYPRMKYIAIGNGGHRSKIGANGIEVGEVLQHKPTHGALFNHLPFVVREPNNDLSPQEREHYGLRTMEEHNGTKFIVYYLRRLDVSNLSTQLKYTTVTSKGLNDTTTQDTDYTPTERDVLYPTPEPLKTIDVNTLNGDYVRCEAVLSLVMSKAELDELKNACKIIYGDERYAVISEIGLVSGVDKVVPSTTGGNFNYTEVISAQIVAFVATDFRAYYHNKKVTLDINIGASEPMFELVAP